MQKNPQQEEFEQTGGLAGLGAGAVTGASVGSAFIPVPIIGTFTGALIGGILGSQIGKGVGGALLTFINPEEEADVASVAPERPTPSPEPAPPIGGADMLNQLERLGRLREQGVITEDEFKAAKARLLGL